MSRDQKGLNPSLPQRQGCEEKKRSCKDGMTSTSIFLRTEKFVLRRKALPVLWEIDVGGGAHGTRDSPSDSADDRLVTRSVISGAARKIGSEGPPGGCSRCQKRAGRNACPTT